MSSSALEQEIYARLLNAPVKIILRDGDDERVATLQDLRSYLEPFGLDIVPSDEVNWATQYPGHAGATLKIFELQQQVDDLTLKKAAE